ncbi:MAG: sigma 54-interacting transcriptional regulator [Planctomycetes bacterium]|nr:sigma 54-interacting transcriptional regulator [Planctomycetota bacterium]
MPKASTQLIGNSPAFRKALSDASVAARQDAPVLVYGETGSGKGVIADYVHRKSGRGGRLVSLNCATFQSNLFESELFGYMRGAFTGAVKDTPGLFEAAEGGTLFLDEIGDTPVEIQPKLLRALEEGVIRRVGGTREIPVDVRLVCATNKDLKELIKAGKFREDLYYRINSFVVTLPPLRERREDIPELATSFLEEHGSREAGAAHTLSPEAAQTLQDYAWPGNIRELRSAMAYAVAQAGARKSILREDLPQALLSEPAETPTDGVHYVERFRDLYRTGAEDGRLWAEFLVAFHDHLGSNKFARGDILTCLRAVRGSEPTNNSLVNEWQRHIKPVPLRLGLIIEDGKKLRIDLEACRQALHGWEPAVDEAFEIETETEVKPPPPLAERNRRTNLDAPRTSFVGRQRELQQLVELLLSGRPSLVTITGPGGTGKTRLSREVGRAVMGALPGGAWFADLTESRNIEGVAYAVAQALGVPLTGNQSPELAVGAILHARAPSLLILDNFEQVAETASGVVDDWMRQAPQVRFLVTSRALLGVEGEQEFELQPLPLPAENAAPEAIAKSEAVRLFIERARVHHVGFQLTDRSAPTVARICQRLEGMPLAIELAAARTVIMQPEQIAERLDKLFDVLKSSRRDLQPRQRSLQATLDWSYDLLSPVERWALAQLSVFRGGFFLDAAERVLDLSRYPDAPAPIDLVQGLREKSLLRAFDTPYETRFDMYQIVRQYAAERWQELANDAERAAVFERFADYYRAYLEHWDGRVFSPESIEALDRMDYARNNVQAVLEWAGAQPARHPLFIELSMHSYHLLRIRGPARARVPSLRAALRLQGEQDSATRARLLFLLSTAEREAGDPVAGRELAELAIEVALRLGDEGLIATAKFNLAGIEYTSDNTPRAQALHREVLPVFQRLGNRANEARVLSRMALMGVELGEVEEALENSRRSEEILREIGDLPGLGFVLSTRGNIYHRMGEHERGLEYYAQAERIFRELNDKRMIAMCLGNRALMNRQLRRFDSAEPLVLETTELARELGDRITLAKNLMNAGIMYAELARYDEAEAVLREGEQLFATQEQPRYQAVCVEFQAYVNGKRGRYDEALQGFNRALKLCEGEEDAVTVGTRTALAESLIESGKPQEAKQLAADAVAYWRDHGRPVQRDYFRALAALAEVEGDAEAAKEALEVAGKLHFSASDPSPHVRTALQKLEQICTP